MTPENKAKELVDNFMFQAKYNCQPSTVLGLSKRCALIVVYEILNNASNEDLENEDAEIMCYEKFWQEVKQEIKNL